MLTENQRKISTITDFLMIFAKLEVIANDARVLFPGIIRCSEYEHKLGVFTAKFSIPDAELIAPEVYETKKEREDFIHLSHLSNQEPELLEQKNRNLCPSSSLIDSS